MMNKLIPCHDYTKNTYYHIYNATTLFNVPKGSFSLWYFQIFLISHKNNGTNWDQMIRNSSSKNVWQKCIGIPNWLHGNNYRLTVLCLHFRFQEIQLKLSSFFSPIYIYDRFFGYKIHHALIFIACNAHFLVKPKAVKFHASKKF